MKEVLEIDKKNMHSIKVAADATGYSRDYITRLAREGKIVATQVGRQWYINLESLEQYAAVSILEQTIKQKHLSQERRQELELVETLQQIKSKKEAALASNSNYVKGMVGMTFSGLVVSSLLLAVFFLPAVSPAKQQLASLSDETSFSAYTILGTELEIGEHSSSSFLGTRKLSDTSEGILLLPENISDDEHLKANDLFSDNVSVRTDELGRTFITQVGTDGELTSNEVPFVLVSLAKLQIP